MSDKQAQSQLPPLQMALVGRTLLVEENLTTGAVIVKSQNLLSDASGKVHQNVAFQAEVQDSAERIVQQAVTAFIQLANSLIPRLTAVEAVPNDDEAAKRIEEALKGEGV